LMNHHLLINGLLMILIQKQRFILFLNSIRSEHKFCTFFVHQQRTGAHKVELLVHSEVDVEFYGESFGNKT
jgi:hypothetical protein